MATVLVTGANGYIGQAAVRYFGHAGWSVHGTSRRAPSQQIIDTVSQWAQLDQLTSETYWGSILEGVDYVLHLAGIAHVSTRGVTEADYFEVNVGGTASLVRACVKAQVKRMVFLSSIGVNGQRSAEKPMREEDAPSPSNAYARSKLAAEKVIQNTLQNQATQWVILRVPMVYGPNAPGNFARLLSLAQRGIPLPIGSSTALRSFICIDNLLDAFHVALTHPHTVNDLFLVCDDMDVTTAEFVRMMASALNRKLWLPSIPVFLLRLVAKSLGREQDVCRCFDPLQIDSSRWRNRTGWKAPVSIQDGLSKAVAAENTLS